MDNEPNVFNLGDVAPKVEYSPNELRLLKLMAGLAFRDSRTRNISFHPSYLDYPTISKHLHLYNIAGFQEFKVDLRDQLDGSDMSVYMALN